VRGEPIRRRRTTFFSEADQLLQYQPPAYVMDTPGHSRSAQLRRPLRPLHENSAIDVRGRSWPSPGIREGNAIISSVGAMRHTPVVRRLDAAGGSTAAFALLSRYRQRFFPRDPKRQFAPAQGGRSG